MRTPSPGDMVYYRKADETDSLAIVVAVEHERFKRDRSSVETALAVMEWPALAGAPVTWRREDDVPYSASKVEHWHWLRNEDEAK